LLAFNALKKKIDDFHESLPLIEMMAHPAMEIRHWENLEKITNHTFNIEDEFSLKSAIQAPLLKFKEEIEVRKNSKKFNNLFLSFQGNLHFCDKRKRY
jgi:hypothetical protein